jgi:hypothetical protein
VLWCRYGDVRGKNCEEMEVEYTYTECVNGIDNHPHKPQDNPQDERNTQDLLQLSSGRQPPPDQPCRLRVFRIVWIIPHALRRPTAEQPRSFLFRVSHASPKGLIGSRKRLRLRVRARGDG